MKIEDLPTSFWVGVIKEDDKEVNAFGYKRQYTDLGKPIQWHVGSNWGDCKWIGIYLRELDEEPIYKYKFDICIGCNDKLSFIVHNWNADKLDFYVDWRMPSYE